MGESPEREIGGGQIEIGGGLKREGGRERGVCGGGGVTRISAFPALVSGHPRTSASAAHLVS